MASTVHLKMKFYSLENEVITLNDGLASAKICHFLYLKPEEEYADSKEVDSKKQVRKQEGLRCELELAECHYFHISIVNRNVFPFEM